ncbi:MAG: hypothetical protein OEZ43_03830 [Gammaproteobacteria bacterium]|nr:hypothetical protein [Gammaproteobacteria bacterium]
MLRNRIKTIERLSVLFLILVSGCASFSSGNSALSLPAGSQETGIGIQGGILDRGITDAKPVVELEFMTRLGITDFLDIEAKLLRGPVLNAKYTLPQENRKFISAIELGIGVKSLPTQNLPLKKDWYFSYYHTIPMPSGRLLSFIPRFIVQQNGDIYTQLRTEYVTGMLINYQFPVQSGISIIPELAIYTKSNDFSDFINTENLTLIPGLSLHKKF